MVKRNLEQISIATEAIARALWALAKPEEDEQGRIHRDRLFGKGLLARMAHFANSFNITLMHMDCIEWTLGEVDWYKPMEEKVSHPDWVVEEEEDYSELFI